MFDTDNKVLACVDRSRFADAVADHAAWAAKRLNAPLEFLHVLDHHPERGSGDDHSGAIGVDAQEKLLERPLSGEDEARSQAMREKGRVFLNRLRERALAAGVASVDIRQRHGNLAGDPHGTGATKFACSSWVGAMNRQNTRNAISVAASSGWFAACTNRS